MNKDYGDFETKALEKLPNAIENMKKEIEPVVNEVKSENVSSLNDMAVPPMVNPMMDLPVASNIAEQNPDILFHDNPDNNGGRKNIPVRVRTDGNSIPINPETALFDEEKKYNILDDLANSKGSSFILIVAGVVTLVGLVSYITFQALSYIGG